MALEFLKRVDDWQSVVVTLAYIAGVIAVVIIGAYLENEILYIGGLIALGIPTSFFGTQAAKVIKGAVNSNPVTGSKEQLETVERAVAELSTILVDLKSEVELIKINGEVKKL